ncbi:hypothetical protein CU098_012954, partial [Rhizopus stolonifer]
MFSKYPGGTLAVTISKLVMDVLNVYLTLFVVEARKLHGEDLIGKNDPYVELWLDDKYKQKTS